MKKRGSKAEKACVFLFLIFIIILLSFSLVSAFSIGDFFKKIFGKKEKTYSPITENRLNILSVALAENQPNRVFCENHGNYHWTGSFHIGFPWTTGNINAFIGSGYNFKQLNGSGWFELCSKDDSAKLIIPMNKSNATQRIENCPSGYERSGSIFVNSGTSSTRRSDYRGVGLWMELCSKNNYAKLIIPMNESNPNQRIENCPVGLTWSGSFMTKSGDSYTGRNVVNSNGLWMELCTKTTNIIEPTPTPTITPSPAPTPTISPTPSPTPTPVVGLIAHYKFENNANDSSINKNHGKIERNVSFVDGLVGKAASFDGIDDFIWVRDNENLKFYTNDFSISLWINFPISGKSYWEGIVSKNYSTSARQGGWGLIRNYNKTNGIAFQDSVENEKFNVNIRVDGILDGWHHVVFVRQAQGNKLYIDRVLNQTQQKPVANLNSNSPLFIGQANGKYIQGQIDELRIYNKALTQEEIDSLYSEISTNRTTINATLTTATLKDNYFVGEQVNLTDPPEETKDKIKKRDNLMFEIMNYIKNKITGKAVQDNNKKQILEDYSLMNYLGNINNIEDINLIKREMREENISKRLEFVPGEIIVKFKSDPEIKKITGFINKIRGKPKISTNKPSINALNKKYKVIDYESLFTNVKQKTFVTKEGRIKTIENIKKLKIKQGKELEAVSDYNKDFNVEYTELNFIRSIDEIIPNDQFFSEQWALRAVSATKAWDINRGSSDVIVAIVDTGINWSHQDLSLNVWNNTDEIPNNGVDDDGNGFIDDVRGYDFVSVPLDWVYPGEDAGPRDNDPNDFHGHGTHVAGIVGAVTNNNIGIVGINWDVKLMPLRAGFKTISGGGSLTDIDINDAIYYAADNNANVISMSFGGDEPSNSTRDALDYAYSRSVFLVAAAGNSAGEFLHYPAAYENVISVAATDVGSKMAFFTQFGNWVDISAPGVNILSTVPPETDYDATHGEDDDGYGSVSGTSMATPYVSGLSALIISQYPSINLGELEERLKGTADIIDYLNYITYRGKIGTGQINAFQALNMQKQPNIGFYSFKISDVQGNINGIIEPNETAEIAIQLKNIWENAENVRVQLSSNYPNLIWINNFSTYPNLSKNSYAPQNSIFKFYLTENSIKGDIVNLIINISANNYSAIRNFEFIVSDDMPILQTGWPVQIDAKLDQPPLIDDIDEDGYKEIVITGSIISNNISVYDYSGNLKKQIHVNGGTVSTVIADVDKDYSGKEIIVETNNAANNSWVGIRIFHADGSEIINQYWPKYVEGWWLDYNSPLVADVNSDGILEIMLLSTIYSYSKIYIWGFNGGYNSEITFGPEEYVNLPFAVGNIDGDHELEIVMATTYHQNFSKIYAWDYDGSIVDNFPILLEGYEFQYGNIVTGDINLDGRDEIIVKDDQQHRPGRFGRAFAINGDGDVLWTFDTYSFNSGFTLSLSSIGNINDDPYPEIILEGEFDPGEGTYRAGQIYALNYNGTLLPNWPVIMPITTISSPPLIADIDLDGKQEIVVISARGDVYAWENEDKNGDRKADLVKGFPFKLDLYLFNPPHAIDDIDLDGNMELVITSTTIFPGMNPSTFVFEIPSSHNTSSIGLEWPMFQHDAQHTGCYGCGKLIPKPLPQSKLVNYGANNLTGFLNIYIQKNQSGTWINYNKTIANYPVNVPSQGLIKLDKIFNPLNVKINEVGDYRVYAFVLDGNGNLIQTLTGKLEAIWNFKVV